MKFLPKNGGSPPVFNQLPSCQASLLRLFSFVFMLPLIRPIPQRIPIATRRRMRGNVFALLFAAVALTGVLAAVGMQTLTGPVTTITKVTQKNIAETNLLMNAKIIINAAVTGVSGGDADADGTIEPAPFTAAAGGEIPPVHGGFLPTNLGLSLTDPWGTKYGYCVWDHGTVNTSVGRIKGDNTVSAGIQPVIAVISAGPDKVFQTTCAEYTSGPIAVTKTGGSDDILQTFTYDAASASSNGLWTLNVQNQAKAELKNAAGSAVNVSINRDTGIGDFLGVTTDTLAAKTNVVSMGGGLKLDTQANVTDCSAGGGGTLRYNASTKKLEICDGTSAWVPVGSDLWGTDGTNIWRATGNVGINNLTPTVPLDVTGAAKVSGNTDIGGTLGVTGATTLASTLDVTGATHLNSTLNVAGTVDVNGGKFTVDATNGNTYADGNLGVKGNVMVNTDKFTVDATNGNTYAAGNLGVTGNVYVNTNKFTIDATNGNTYIAGTLGVIGATTLTDTLTVTGATQLNSTLNVVGNTAVDTNTLFVDATSHQVGIGTASPGARLDVNGGIKIGTQSVCDAGGANNGTVRYDNGVGKLQVCINGWTTVSSIDKLDDIGDVEVPTPNNNDILTWDDTDQKWKAKNINMVGPAQVSPAGANGSVQFKDGSDLAADAANFHWDKTNHRLGVGTNAPTTTLDVAGTLRVSTTSTFGGSMAVDTSTLYVDAGTHRVGIGTTGPLSALDVVGAIKLGNQTTCDSGGANDGTIRYNTGELQICKTGTWTRISTDSGIAGSAPDAIDCGTNGTRRILFLQTTTAAEYRYQMIGGSLGVGMKAVYSSGGAHVSTVNTAQWSDATGCDGKNFATLTSEGRAFFMLGGAGVVSVTNAITSLTGDVVASGPGAAVAVIQNSAVTTAKIAGKAVTYGKIQDVSASNRLLGRASGGAGSVEEIVLGTGLTLSGNTLNADTITDGNKGDITVSSTGTVWTINSGAVDSAKILDGSIATVDLANKAVTLAKLQDIATNSLLGRSSAGAGVPEVITVGTGLTLTGGVLATDGNSAASGTVEGAIQFRGTTAVLASDEGNFKWDNTNKRLGIGIAVPTEALDVVGRVTTNSLLLKSVAGSAPVGGSGGGGGGGALATLSDVVISSPSNGQALTYDTATSKWKNATVAAGGVWATDGTHVWRTTGNVGVRNATPTFPLDVIGSTSGATQLAARFSVAATGGVGYGGTIMLHNTDTTVDNVTGVMGNNASGFAVAGIEFVNHNHGNASVRSGKLSLFTMSGAGSANYTVMDENGKVGIGTATPANKLEVYTTTSTQGITIDGTSAPGLTLKNSGTAKAYLGLATAAGNWDGNAAAGDVIMRVEGGAFRVNTNSGGGTSALTVNGSNGNVGIGVTAPTTALDVAGTGIRSSAAGGYPLSLGSSNTTGTWLTMANSSGGGTTQAIISSGSGNGEGAGKMLFWTTGGGTTMTINNSGNVGIGTSNPTNKLEVASTNGSQNAFYSTNTGGGVAIYGYTNNAASAVIGDNQGAGWGVLCNRGLCGGNQAWTNTSDVRLKERIENLPDARGLALVEQMRPVTYHWKDKDKDALTGQRIGFIAQEIEKLYPEAVSTDSKTTLKSLSYAELTVPLVKAVQELKALFDGLVAQVKDLAAQVLGLKDDVAKLKAENAALKAANDAQNIKLDALMKRLDALEAKP